MSTQIACGRPDRWSDRASASTDGVRLFTVSRSGKVVALDARTGDVLWTDQINTLGYSTPAIARDRVFVGDFAGGLRAYRKTDGALLWRTVVGGRILGGAVVVVGGAVVVGGRSVGVPGTVRLLEAVHRKHGRLEWAALFAPAIALAESGFALSPRLHALLAADKYMTQPRLRAYFFDANGKVLPVGTTLRNSSAVRRTRRSPLSPRRSARSTTSPRCTISGVRSR